MGYFKFASAAVLLLAGRAVVAEICGRPGYYNKSTYLIGDVAQATPKLCKAACLEFTGCLSFEQGLGLCLFFSVKTAQNDMTPVDNYPFSFYDIECLVCIP